MSNFVEYIKINNWICNRKDETKKDTGILRGDLYQVDEFFLNFYLMKKLEHVYVIDIPENASYLHDITCEDQINVIP